VDRRTARRAGPHRGAAAPLLWAYYTGLKRGEILPPERLAVAKQ
jgi:3-methyladenine DNA glycosylase/8-oxoguanine DNA glycosylase